MEELKTQLISVASGVALAILGFIFAYVRAKIKAASSKIQEPLEEKLKSWLNGEVLGILRNVYQTFTKNLKANHNALTEEQQKTAIQKAYDSLINLMPKSFLNIAKQLYPNYELTLKEYIQRFYEENKTKININIIPETNNNICEEN